MASKENEDKVNEAIMNMLRRGHPHRGKKMNPPAGEDGELAFRPRKDSPPGYDKPDGSAPPNYGSKIEEPVTKEKPSIAEKVPVPGGVSEMVFRLREDTPPGYDKSDGLATSNYDSKSKAPVTMEKPSGSEEAPVADNKYKKPANFILDPSYFMRKRAAAKKNGPTETQIGEAKIKKMMDGLSSIVKTEQEVEQGTKLSDYDIAQRADAHFIKKNLKLRYFHECSEEHFNEFKNLVSKGMSVDEACAAHSDFGAWMFIESERERFRS